MKVFQYREQDVSFSPFFFVLSIFICNFAAETCEKGNIMAAGLKKLSLCA